MVTRTLLVAAVCALTIASCSAGSGDLPGATGGSRSGRKGGAGGVKSAGAGGAAGEQAAGGASSAGSAGVGSPPGCVPKTCLALGKSCGAVTDTVCGGVIECGTCKGSDVCGGAGVPNVCGTGQAACTPKTCKGLSFDCGAASDGCGGTLECGETCPSGQICGANDVPNVCGMGTCTPKTCPTIGVSCGPAGDGCGEALACGDCATGTCGGGGVPGKCGVPVCQKLTCPDQGVSCGVAADGCGGTVSCGSCNVPQICGGAGKPGVCGCTGVCADVATCAKGKETSISGKVFDPAGKLPLYNVLVYVPNTKETLAPFAPGLTCDQCGATADGDPIVSTHTAPDGTFTLKGVPTGKDVPIVIQLGRWRRQFRLEVKSSCADNKIAGTTLRMPRNKGEGDIPRMALLSGTVDGLECVLRKIGLDDSEFGNPGAASDPRVAFYKSDTIGTSEGSTYGAGAVIDGTTPGQAALFAPTAGGKPAIQGYDLVLLACPGLPGAKDDGQEAALRDFANAGGRVFSTHYSYPWLTKRLTPTASQPTDGPFESVASWTPQDGAYDTIDGSIDTTSNPRGKDFKAWLKAVNALAPDLFGFGGTVSIAQSRRDASKVNPPTQRWISAPSQGDFPLHFTFNTPVGAANASQCGRVLFSDFHVQNAYNLGKTFPEECPGGDLTAQEKILEFMIFDLGSCVQPYKPVCTPTDCTKQGFGCGAAGDGCGGAIDCGVCETGICGGAGPGKCGAPVCKALSCADQGFECGPAGDGCGGPLDCGPCETGICGGGAKPGVCGTATCTPTTCAKQGIQCGPAGDGCGKALPCGTCPPGQVCGLDAPGKCGSPSCKPTTCLAQGVECGPAGDGCGNKIECGNCPTGQICGLLESGKCDRPAQ